MRRTIRPLQRPALVRRSRAPAVQRPDSPALRADGTGGDVVPPERRRPPETGAISATQEQLWQLGTGEHFAESAVERAYGVGGNDQP